MQTLKNSRREKFADLVAQGLSFSSAYEQAGYRSHSGNACTLAQQPDVRARVEEIRASRSLDDRKAREIAVKSLGITKQTLLEDARRIMRAAEEAGQYGAATSALKEIGILSGERVERSERGTPNEFKGVSTAQLLDELRELGYDVRECSERAVPPSQAVN
jgi:hypothetical protein